MKTKIICLTVGLTFMLIGCASVNPRIASIDRSSKPPSNDLASTKTSVLNLKKEFQEKIDIQQRNNAWSRLGIFGSTLGAGTAAIYKAHTDTFIGLGLLSAASYAAGYLYTPAVYSDIYDAGLAAAQCLDAFVSPAAAMMPIISADKKILDNAINDYEKLIPPPDTLASKNKERAKILSSAKQKSNQATSYIAREPLLAATVQVAADDIVRIANKQIRENTPSLEAFSSVTRSVFSSTGNIPGISPPADTSKPPSTEAALIANSQDEMESGIRIVNEAQQKLNATLNTFDKLGDPQNSICVDKAKLDVAKPLAASTAIVGLVTSLPFIVNVSGGRPSYTGGWVGTMPPRETIDAGLAPFSSTAFQFIARKTFKGSYKYIVQDSAGATIELTVTMPDKPE